MLDLMAGQSTTLEPLPGRLVRHTLTAGAWVDVFPGWVRGSDPVFETLLTEVDWRAERRAMYDGIVDVPRLLRWYGGGDALPHPTLTQARDRLSAHYEPELGEARDALVEAFDRGVPVFTLGLSRLIHGLSEFPDDPECVTRLDQARLLSYRVDMREPFVIVGLRGVPK
jgi:hypothetical protein